MVSAVAGGQWCQYRKSKIRNGAVQGPVDNRCQLCLRHTGPLMHRRACPDIRPFAGWADLPACDAAYLAGMTASRQELLLTRGLAVHPLTIPPLHVSALALAVNVR